MTHLCTLRGNGTVYAVERRVREVSYVIIIGQHRADGGKKGRGTIDGDVRDLYKIFLTEEPSLRLQCGATLDFMVTQLTVTQHAPTFCEIVTTGELPECCSSAPGTPDQS